MTEMSSKWRRTYKGAKRGKYELGNWKKIDKGVVNEIIATRHPEILTYRIVQTKYDSKTGKIFQRKEKFFNDRRSAIKFIKRLKRER